MPRGRKPNPNKIISPGKGKGRKGPRPHVWKCGPDEYKHQMYVPWMMAKAQAKFRGEEWDLSFDEYFELWNGNWDQRGRAADDLCMTRKDWERGWHLSNCYIAVRTEHLVRQGHARKGISYKERKK